MSGSGTLPRGAAAATRGVAGLALFNAALFAAGLALALLAVLRGDYHERGEAAGLAQDVFELQYTLTLLLFAPLALAGYGLVRALDGRAGAATRLRGWTPSRRAAAIAVLALVLVYGLPVAGLLTLPGSTS